MHTTRTVAHLLSRYIQHGTGSTRGTALAHLSLAWKNPRSDGVLAGEVGADIALLSTVAHARRVLGPSGLVRGKLDGVVVAAHPDPVRASLKPPQPRWACDGPRGPELFKNRRGLGAMRLRQGRLGRWLCIQSGSGPRAGKVRASSERIPLPTALLPPKAAHKGQELRLGTRPQAVIIFRFAAIARGVYCGATASGTARHRERSAGEFREAVRPQVFACGVDLEWTCRPHARACRLGREGAILTPVAVRDRSERSERAGDRQTPPNRHFRIWTKIASPQHEADESELSRQKQSRSRFGLNAHFLVYTF
eukprot:3123083-Rhodomonas_salina.1